MSIFRKKGGRSNARNPSADFAEAELRRVQELLKRSEDRFQTLLAALPDVVVITDVGGNILFINEIGVSLGGYTGKESFLGRHMFSFIAPADVERARINTEIMFVKRLGPIEYNLITADGRHIPCEINGEVLRHADQVPYGIIYAIRDVHERHRVEASLRESEEKYRQLVANLGEGVAVVDTGECFSFVNPAAERIFGVEEGELLGKSLREFMSEKQFERIREQTERRQRGERGTYELEIVRADGARRTLQITATAQFDNQGQYSGAFGILLDVTEFRQAEEERWLLEERLLRAEKMEALGTLAGGVAHDLNNILGVLVGYSELLLREIPEGTRQRKHVANILKSAERGAAVIQDLLTMARRGVAVPDVVNLNEVIRDFLMTPESQKLSSLYPNMQVFTDLADDLLNIQGSAVHLSKTIMNLVTNAAEAMAGEGIVSISTCNCYLDVPVRGFEEMKAGEYAVVEVSDTGKGIAAADLSRIFEPFYTKKAMGRSGTGLGLSVVWGTVKDHRGYVDVRSSIGEGSAFTLYFPATRREVHRERPVVSLDSFRGRGEAVLIVDDDAEQREVASAMLAELGYRVHAVASGSQALAFLREQPVDLVLLDMILDSEMDGLQAFSKIRELRPLQKALIVSGFSQTERVTQALALGAGAYIRKPYLLEKIGQAVRCELDRKPDERGVP